ncbi:hypothetical protein T11_11467 [Trichinella zimbabwensis]|uniref:Uncharacterized protein n=1 Tax=Trichinella zimbabwensis TaxID=268475 RepID=A0A0V1HV18_9BILA|nr:hypothetical protein T11_11467 [Trichinella zimbabwensis]
MFKLCNTKRRLRRLNERYSENMSSESCTSNFKLKKVHLQLFPSLRFNVSNFRFWRTQATI